MTALDWCSLTQQRVLYLHVHCTVLELRGNLPGIHTPGPGFHEISTAWNIGILLELIKYLHNILQKETAFLFYLTFMCGRNWILFQPLSSYKLFYIVIYGKKIPLGAHSIFITFCTPSKTSELSMKNWRIQSHAENMKKIVGALALGSKKMASPLPYILSCLFLMVYVVCLLWLYSESPNSKMGTFYFEHIPKRALYIINEDIPKRARSFNFDQIPKRALFHYASILKRAPSALSTEKRAHFKKVHSRKGTFYFQHIP